MNNMIRVQTITETIGLTTGLGFPERSNWSERGGRSWLVSSVSRVLLFDALLGFPATSAPFPTYST